MLVQNEQRKLALAPLKCCEPNQTGPAEPLNAAASTSDLGNDGDELERG